MRSLWIPVIQSYAGVSSADQAHLAGYHISAEHHAASCKPGCRAHTQARTSALGPGFHFDRTRPAWTHFQPPPSFGAVQLFLTIYLKRVARGSSPSSASWPGCWWWPCSGQRQEPPHGNKDKTSFYQPRFSEKWPGSASISCTLSCSLQNTT